MKKPERNQPVLRLVWSRDGEEEGARSSSTEMPVTSDKRRSFLLDGMPPFSHSQTVGCLTSIRPAKSVCDVDVSFSHRRKRSIPPNIGDSYANAIGRTYGGIGNTSGMKKEKLNETVVDRALRAAKLKFKRRVTLAEIGKWAGNVKQPSVSEWRQPGRNPSIENVKSLALELDVCVDWLLTGREPMYAGRPSDEALMRLLDYWPFLDDFTKGEILGQAHHVAREHHAFVQEQRDKRSNA
jgi:CI repressor-like protein